MSKPRVDLADVIAIRGAAEFETWLADHVDEERGVWLQKAAARPIAPAPLEG